MAAEYKVNITKYAYAQMAEIKQYISCELQAPMAVKTLLLAIKSAALSLAVMPARHSLMQKENGVVKACVKWL